MESLARWTRYFSVSQSVNGVSGLVIIPKGRHEAGRKDRRSFSTEEFKEDRAETTTPTTRRRRAREKTYLHLHWRAQIVGKKRESNKGGEQVPGGRGRTLSRREIDFYTGVFSPLPRIYTAIQRNYPYPLLSYLWVPNKTRRELISSFFFLRLTYGKTIKTTIVLSFFGNFV